MPTFTDTMALVRQSLWPCNFSMSESPSNIVKISRTLLERLTDTLVYAT